MRTLTILLLLLSSLTYGQETPNDTSKINIEQIAFNYFTEKIDETFLYYDSFVKFRIDSNKIYVFPLTRNKGSLNLHHMDKFIEGIDSSDASFDLKIDTTIYTLDLSHPSVINSKIKSHHKSNKPLDIYVVFSSRFYFKEHYYIKVIIGAKPYWKTNDAIIKLNKEGIPLDIKFTHGES